MGGGIRIEDDDDVIEVEAATLLARPSMRNFVDHRDEPSRRRVALLRHDQPLEEARGRAECRERGCLFVSPDKGLCFMNHTKITWYLSYQ